MNVLKEIKSLDDGSIYSTNNKKRLIYFTSNALYMNPNIDIRSIITASVYHSLGVKLDYWTDSTVGCLFSILDGDYNRLKFSYVAATTYGTDKYRNEKRKHFILTLCNKLDGEIYNRLHEDIKSDNLGYDPDLLPKHLIKMFSFK